MISSENNVNPQLRSGSPSLSSSSDNSKRLVRLQLRFRGVSPLTSLIIGVEFGKRRPLAALLASLMILLSEVTKVSPTPMTGLSNTLISAS